MALDPEMAERFTRIELMLSQILSRMRAKQQTQDRRARTMAHKALAKAMEQPPTEFEVVRAKRILSRAITKKR